MGLKLTQTWKQSRETNKSPDKRFEQKQRSFVSFLDFLATTKKTRSVETFQDLNFRLHIIFVILTRQTKAELLLLKLIHLFAKEVFLVKSWKSKKLRPLIIQLFFGMYNISGLSFFDLQLFQY